MKFNRVGKIALASALVFSTLASVGFTSSVFADSGYSALPPKDSKFHQWAYKTYAPKTQTSYKHFRTVTKKVSDIKKESGQMVAFGNDLVMGSVLTGFGGKKKLKLLKFSTLTKVLAGTGAVIYAGGRASQIAYSKVESGAVLKSKIYFKWTNAQRLEYSVKVVSHIEYKGKVISEKKTYYYNKSL